MVAVIGGTEPMRDASYENRFRTSEGLVSVRASRTQRVLPTLLTVVVAISGCTASIERRRAPDIDARIVGSDRSGIVVETDRGERRRIPGSEIKEIDHPGNVLMTVGAIFAGLALLSAESQNPNDRAEADGLAVVGLSLFVGGAIPYFRSTGASGEFDPADIPAVDTSRPVREDTPATRPKNPKKGSRPSKPSRTN